jgi:hypothetical protein
MPKKRKRASYKLSAAAAGGLLTAIGSASPADAVQRRPIGQINLSSHHHRRHPEAGYYYFPVDIYQRYPDRTYCDHLG